MQGLSVPRRLNFNVLFVGRTELIDKLLEDEAMKSQKSAVEGLEDLRVLFKYLELYGITDKVHVHRLDYH